MIKFLGSSKGRPLIGIGLSRANCTKLLEGKPILVDLRVMRQAVPAEQDLNHANLLVFAGETEETMRLQLDIEVGIPDQTLKHNDEN